MSSYLKSKSLLEQWYLTDKGAESLNFICKYLEWFFSNFLPRNYLQLGSIGHKELSTVLGAENVVVIENHKIPLTEHIVGEFDLLPVLEDHFDVIVLPHILETSDPNGVLFESYRVLKPGGILVVIGFDVNLFNTISGYFNNNIYKAYARDAELMHINVVNRKLAVAGFKLIDNKYFCVKDYMFNKDAHKEDKLQKFFSLIAGDIYVSISKKEITNLELIKNKNSLFSKKTISLPGDTAWD